MSKLSIKLVPPQKKSTKKKNKERKSKGLVSQQPMPFITLEELIKQLTDEYVQKQRTPVMLDEFMSEGWRTRIPRNDDDDEDHSPIIIEFWGRIDAVTDSDYDKETPYSSQKKKNLRFSL